MMETENNNTTKKTMDIAAIKSALDESVITNAKLASTLSIFNAYHLTNEEKEKIGMRIESTSTLKQLNEVHGLIISELDASGYSDENDNKWSPMFVREFIRPLAEGDDFEPIQNIKDMVNNIEMYSNLDERVEKLSSKEKDSIKEELSEQKEQFRASVKSLRKLVESISFLSKDNENNEEEESV